MSTMLHTLCAVLVGASSAAAQFLEVSPNPVPQNATCTFTVTDTSGMGITLGSSCTWFDIHSGSQTGPIVALNVFCAAVLVNVPANGSASSVWDLIDGNTGLPVAPGRYWIQSRVFDSAFNTIRRWACVDVVATGSTGAPSLTQLGPARVGQMVSFQSVSANQPGEPFATLLSFDQELPLALPGFVDLCISAPVFVVQDGVLDSAGVAPTFVFQIPNTPSLAFTGFHLQTVVVDTTLLTLTDTNAQAVLIRP